MTTLSVGSPFVAGRRSFPEAVQYNYDAGGHSLVVFLAGLSEEEVDDIRTGPVSFALYVEAPLILLLYRFPPGRWNDAPYSWHLVPENRRDLPSSDLASAERTTIHVILVEARSGIVRALRLLSVSHEFTVELHRAIREQAATPWDPGAYDRALDALYLAKTSDELAAQALVTSEGGA